jgi:hypothetical protein
MWNPPASDLDWLVPLRLLIPVLGFGGIAVGLILIRRITRFGGDEVAHWRYRDLDPEIDVERDDTLGDARRVARFELLVGGAWPFVILAALVMQPGSFRGMFYDPTPEIVGLAAGWVVYLIGLAWMIRIYRFSHLEPYTSNWRYRDF